MKYIKILILAIIYLFIGSTANAQSLNTARTWYIYGHYSKALPVFKKELIKKPNDSSINFWYGVCLLKTGKQSESLPYLFKSKKRNIIDADLYLAEYYYITKDPYNALKEIKIYKSKRLTSSKRVKINNLEKKVNEYIKTKFKVEDILITDSVIVNKKSMYKEVQLSSSAGELVSTKKFFNDNNKIESYAYLSQRKDRIYFADKKSEENNNLDLFLSYKILDKWKEITPLSKTINSPKNEINPYILQDGVTIYFASKKDTTSNNYNLYISRYNPETKNFYIPQKLNAPFNSPANDYFLILDENKNRGYFASDRNNKNDSVTIYTFIPNEKIELIKTDDINKLMSRALIKSIKDTWKNKNLDSLLETSNKPIINKTTINEEEQEKETFIINDTIQYTKETQFKSKSAKEDFKTYRVLKTQLDEKQKEIIIERQYYFSANKNKKNTIGNSILKLEQSISNLKIKIPSLELKIRNEENAEIKKESKQN